MYTNRIGPSRQVKLRLPVGAYAELERRADDVGAAPAGIARVLLTKLLLSPDAEVSPQPRRRPQSA